LRLAITNRDPRFAHPCARFHHPIYRTPPDLVRCTRADGGTGRGRIDASGQCVYYYTRAEIEAGALAGRGLEIGYAADPIDLFFLQIQGSGRLLLPDGGVMRIGYDNQNGREYVAIGRVLRARGILPAGGAGMKEIVAWMRANPAEGAALMRENLSYIFFKELTGPGPLGALALPVTPRATVAPIPTSCPWARQCSSTWTAPKPTDYGWHRILAARSRVRTDSTPSGARALMRKSLPAAWRRMVGR
jgi:membrane-bound lytic murein transglycosylase A